MSECPVRLAREGAVAIVTLNRPHRLNATNDELGRAMEEAFLSVGTDPSVRAIVLTGAGGHFCAGGDIARLREILDHGASVLPGAGPDTENPRFAPLADAPDGTRSRYLLPLAVPQPVIAAIEGACAGAGLVLATGCDARFVAPSAIFAAGFARRGLIAENGLAFMLPRLIGHGAASDLLISGRKIGAEEALRLGLANAILPAEELFGHALAYARDLAANVSPRAAAVIKRQLQHAQTGTLRDALAESWREMVASFATPDFAEGIASFEAKRPAQFPDRCRG